MTNASGNANNNQHNHHATCQANCTILSETGHHVLGHLRLAQSESHQPISITGTLAHLTPGKHGLAICVSGDLSNGANSCGPIFNPYGKTHGAPSDEMRQVGDLGNILADENGSATIALTDSKIQLLGPHSVIGRSIILYAGEDDRGRGGHELSLTNGNPGPRIAAGVIGLCA